MPDDARICLAPVHQPALFPVEWLEATRPATRGTEELVVTLVGIERASQRPRGSASEPRRTGRASVTGVPQVAETAAWSRT